MAPPRSPRCPRCGFGFAWDGRKCGHCPPPARARQLWEQITHLSELTGSTKNLSQRHQLLIVRECLWQVRDAIPGNVTDVLEDSWRFEAESVGRYGNGHLLQHLQANLARLYTWTHHSPDPDINRLASMCCQERARQVLPDRNLIDHSLPDHLESHRQAVTEYLAWILPQGRGRVTISDRPNTDPIRQAVDCLNEKADEYRRRQWHASQAAETAQCGIARDVLGYPEVTINFLPEWRTSTAVAMARGMHESRDFFAMPILADALQDAGCDDPEVLEHCRGDKPHFRGCWVIEYLLRNS
jgi:hypothetical protein